KSHTERTAPSYKTAEMTPDPVYSPTTGFSGLDKKAATADCVEGDDMELTTLALALVLGLGLLGADSVLHAGSVEVEVAIAPKVENISVDEQTLASRFKDVFDEITSTASVVRPPEIRSRIDQGLGMALFEAVHAQNVAFALQRELGYSPDRIRFALFVENGAMRGLVNGNGHLVGNFSQVITPNSGESLMNFVRR